MCRVLEVSETGYYKFRRNLGKPDKDAILSAGIKRFLTNLFLMIITVCNVCKLLFLITVSQQGYAK